MKVLIVVDKSGTAIDRLATLVQKHNPRHEIKLLPVHPKRNDAETMYEASNLLQWCDVIDVHYWKSGEILKTAFAKQFFEKPRILFHFNPYDVVQQNWLDTYDKVVVGNKEIQNKIPYAELIPYGIDLDFFKFNDDYTEEQIVMMSVARIEGKKGVYEVAKACKELGYKFKLVGRVSKGEYMQKILDLREGDWFVEFFENATDEQLREIYHTSAIHVCNSVDGFESGTLPIVESMACGLPVLTRAVGHVPDLNNGKNMVVRRGKPEDVEDIKKHLKEMMEVREQRLKLRTNGWNTARQRDGRVMVSKIIKLYNQLYQPDRSLVSILIPTKDNLESFAECLVAASLQDYKKYELVVADSGVTPVKKIIDELKKKVEIPITYIHFPHKNNYTLAEARNRAIIEAEGDILVFCDDRLRMENDAVSQFVKLLSPNMWVWGVKDDYPKSFVENFSAIFRKDFIKRGMFLERMQTYGGMTQELRTRYEGLNGVNFSMVSEAKATSIRRSKSKASRRADVIESKYLIHKLYG